MLPLTLGPEILLGLSFCCFLAGYLFLPLAWSVWIELLVIVPLGLGLFFIHRTEWFLVNLAIFFLLMGSFANKPSYPGNHDPIKYYRLSAVKERETTVQAFGKVYERKGSILVATPQTVLCTFRKNKTNLRSGDVLLAASEINPIVPDLNPGSFDPVNYYRSKGIANSSFIKDTFLRVGHVNHWREEITRFRCTLGSIFDRQLAPEEAGLAKALLLGDASEVQSSNKQTFSATGAIHVLAVSGMHVSLFAQMLLIVLSLFHRFLSKTTAQLVCIVVLGNYALLTGLSPSVLRSVIMFTFLQMAQIFGRESNSNHLLLMCAFVMVLLDPPCMYDIGFQLSFLAVLGIFNFQKPIASWLKPTHKVIKFFWETTAVSLAAQSLTLPLTLYYFHTFPNYFLLANLGVAVLSVAAMYLGFFYLIVCAIPILSEMAAFPFQWSLKALIRFLETIANIPGAVAEGYLVAPSMMVLMLLSIALLFYTKIPRIVRVIPLSLIVISVTLSRYQRQSENHLYVLKANTPLFVYKKGSYANVVVPGKTVTDNVRMLCNNYQKIYPLTKIDTTFLLPGDSIAISSISLVHRNDSLYLYQKTLSSISAEKHPLSWKYNQSPKLPVKIAF